MKGQSDLLSWLNREHLSKLDALKLAIKAWNSIDYTNLSKYETIVRFFCENFPSLCQEAKDSDELWATVREFVELKYPVGVVTSEARCLLIDCLVENINAPQPESFIVLKNAPENPFFVSFFSANVSTYGKLLGKCLVVWKAILESDTHQDALEGEEKQITEDLLRNLRDFAQYQANNFTFGKIYLTEIHQKITELVIYLQTRKFIWKKNLFVIFRGLFFTEESGKLYKGYFEASGKGEKLHEDRINFQGNSLHVTLMEIEGFFFAYSVQRDLCFSFIDFLLRDLFIPSRMDFSEVVLAISHSIFLAKSHSIRLSGSDELSLGIRKKLLEILEEFAESNTKDCLCLLLRSLQLNPMLLVEDLSQLIVKFLFLPKNEETLELFGQFFALSLETFHKLSRFEKNLNKLLESVASAATTVEFSKKLKRKLKEKVASPQKRRKITESGDFLQILTEDPAEKHRRMTGEQKIWSDVSFAWSEDFSQRFSKIILNLVPNASLQVWKGLIFSVQDTLDTAKARQFDESSLFCVDFVVKIFCAYLRGCRLLERPDNVLEKIEERRTLTRNIVRRFLEILEARTTEGRPLGAFLELLTVLLDFETALMLYRPDFLTGTTSESLRRIHYVDLEEWSRISSRCSDENLQNLTNSINFKLLKLNYIEKSVPENFSENLERILKDPGEFRNMIVHQQDVIWLLKHLRREQKTSLAELFAENLQLLEDPKHLEILEDEEFLSLLILKIFNRISKGINSKKAPFCKIDFDALLSEGASFDGVAEKVLHQVKTVNLKDLATDDLHEILQSMKLLPIGFLEREAKNRTLFHLVVLLHTLKDFNKLQTVLLHLLTQLTELGNTIDVFKYVPIRKISEMFPRASEHSKLYELLFSGVSRYETKSNVEGLRELLTIVEEQTESSDLCLIALECLKKTKNRQISVIKTKLTAVAVKSFRKVTDFDGLLRPFAATLTAYFDTKEKVAEDRKLGSIALKFINHFKGIQNSDVVDLLKIVTDHRDVLQIEQASLTPIIVEFSDQMRKNGEVSTEIACIVVQNSTNEDFTKLLNDFEAEAKTLDPICVCKTLQNLGSRISEEKGEVFSHFYEGVLSEITAKLILKAPSEDSSHLALDILKTHTVIVKNKKIPLSNELFQNILIFLVEINLKAFKINLKDFTSLHLQMTELCYAINQHRSSSLRFAMPQFVSIFKDLVHGICAYRSDRMEKDKLEQDEVEALTELAHKMELMIAFMASANKNARRVAPFMLVFVINEMIYNQNSTTLNPGIKAHINNICYSLISMCDPSCGQFILRGCSEASRNLYKTLLKEYTRYYKFQGKV